MEAFITGSRAYGTAGPYSDLDLCVLMSEATLKTLTREFDFPIRIGTLNIIPCTTELEMLAWKRATDACIALATREGKLDKDKAIEIHEACRIALGVPERDMGGSGHLFTPDEVEYALDRLKPY